MPSNDQCKDVGRGSTITFVELREGLGAFKISTLPKLAFILPITSGSLIDLTTKSVFIRLATINKKQVLNYHILE